MEVRGPMYLRQRIWNAEPISLSFLPHSSLIQKMHPSTAGLTERHFQSPAERSQIRTRNLLYYNRALCVWNKLINKVNVFDICSFRISDHIVVFIRLSLFCDLERTLQYKRMIKPPFSPCLTLLLKVRRGPPYWNNSDKIVFHDVTSFATHVINCASHLRILDLKGFHL